MRLHQKCLAIVATMVAAAPVHADLLVGDFNNHKVLRFSDTGALIGTFGQAGDEVGLGIPGGITFDSAGRTYVKSMTSGDILRFTVTGTFLDVFGNARSGAQRGLAFDSNESLWLRRIQSAGTFGNEIVRIDTSGNIVQTFNSGLAGLGGAILDRNDVLYVPRAELTDDTGNLTDGIYRFTTDGTALGVFGQATGAISGCRLPGSVAFDSVGRLYVSSDGRILRYSTTGDYLGVFATGNIGGYIMLDPLDNVYIGHGSENGVMKYGPQGNFLGKIISAGLGGVPANFRNEAIAYIPPIPEPGCSLLLVTTTFTLLRRNRRIRSGAGDGNDTLVGRAGAAACLMLMRPFRGSINSCRSMCTCPVAPRGPRR